MKRTSILFVALAAAVIAGLPTVSHATVTPKAPTIRISSVAPNATLSMEAMPGGVTVVNPGPAAINIYIDGFYAGTVVPYGTLTVGVGNGLHTLTGYAPGLSFGPMVAPCGFFTWYL